MNIDPRHLVQLSQIVETGSFTRAANALAIAPAALTRNIKTLEKRAGGLLLERSKAGAKATPLGTRLAELGRTIHLANQHAMAVSASIGPTGNPSVRVGAAPFVATYFLLESAVDLMTDPGDIDVQVRMSVSPDLFRMVRHGEIDLAIGQFSQPAENDGMILIPLTDDALTIVARPEHPLSKRRPITADDLEGYPWVLAYPGLPLRAQVETEMRRLKIGHAKVALEVENQVLIPMALQQADLLSMVPRLPTAPLVADGKLCELLPQSIDRRRKLGILVQAHKRNTLAIRTLQNSLRERAQVLTATVEAIAQTFTASNTGR